MSENELATVNPNVPAYLQDYSGDLGKEGLEKDIRFPSLFCCRTGSKLATAGMTPGAVFETIGKTEVLPVGGKFHVIPILYYDSFKLMYDRERAEQNPVKEYTLDKESELARMAQQYSVDQRQIPDPERIGQLTKKKLPFLLTAVHSKNFIVYLPFLEQELPRLAFPVAQLSFDKGEFRTGQTFGALIQARVNAPIHACMFEVTVGLHTSKDPAYPPWYGFNLNNSLDESRRFASDSQFAAATKWRETVKAAFNERVAKINDYVDVESEAEGTASAVPM